MSGLTRGFPTSKNFPQFDSAAGDAAQNLTLDPIDQRAALAAVQDVRRAGMAIVLQLADDISNDALDDGELPSERLDTYMQAAMDVQDGEAPDENVLQLLSANVADAFSTLGCSDDLINDIFSDDPATADSAIETASDTIIGGLPDDGEALDDLTKQFIYGFGYTDIGEADDGDADEPGFDAMKSKKKMAVGKTTFRKVGGHTLKYKAIKAVRHGKVVVINKRVAGTVKLSAAQRAGLNKARIKAMTPAAFKRAPRSLVKGIVAHVYHPKHAASMIRMAQGGAKKFGG